MKSIKEIYQELNKPSCFRIRNVNTLEDWVAGQRFDWTYNDGELSFISAACLNGKRGVLKMLLDASKREWAILSTKKEIEYLKAYPPIMQWQRLSDFYTKILGENGNLGYF